MFDFAWSEIVLIAAVALIAIGPKDMPAAIRTVSGLVKKARRMAGEFQTHVDEMVREADLGDVKKAFSEIRNFDIHGAMEKAVDPDRSLRNTFASNPLEPTYPTPEAAPTLDEVTVIAPTGMQPVPPTEASTETASAHTANAPAPPAFIPPALVPPPLIQAAAPPPEAPPFIPPEAVRQRYPGP